jgi:hypothetical protein
MKRWLILFSVVCLTVAGAASASVQQGDTELEALGAYMNIDTQGSGDVDTFFLSAGVGYFVTDNVQIGGAALGMWADTPSGDLDVWAIGGSAKYFFMPTNQWVPYAGGQILWANADAGNNGDADGVLWGPVVGVRYELNAYNDFFVEGQYHLWDGDIGDYLDDGFGIFFGIVHQFK